MSAEEGGQTVDQSKQISEKQSASREFEGARDKYSREFENMFGRLIEPDETASAVLSDAVNYLKAQPGYMDQVNRTKDLLRQQWGKIVDLMIDRYRKEADTTKNVRGALGDLSSKLDMYLDTFKTVGSAIKNRDNEQGTFTTKELIDFETWAHSLRGMHPEELIDMMEENRQILGIFDDPKLLNPEQAEYKARLEHLMHFILDEKEQTPLRKQAEVLLWQEIVKKFDYEQKRDLILMFLDKAGFQATQKFMAQGIMLDMFSRVELLHMYRDNKDKFSAFGDEKKFDDLLKAVGLYKEQEVKTMEDFAKQMEVPQIQSGVTYFFEFNKLAVETVARCGALTAILNTAFNIIDRVKGRPQGSSRITAGLFGIMDAVKNPYVWGGAAVAVAGSHVIHPWVRAALFSPDGVTAKKLAENHETRYLQDTANNRHEILNYFTNHYDELLSIAKERKGNKAKNPLTGVEETREKDLYPEDLIGKSAPKDIQKSFKALAMEMNVEPKELTGDMAHLFDIFTKVFANENLDTGDKLDDFLTKYIV